MRRVNKLSNEPVLATRKVSEDQGRDEHYPLLPAMHLLVRRRLQAPARPLSVRAQPDAAHSMPDARPSRAAASTTPVALNTDRISERRIVATACDDAMAVHVSGGVRGTPNRGLGASDDPFSERRKSAVAGRGAFVTRRSVETQGCRLETRRVWMIGAAAKAGAEHHDWLSVRASASPARALPSPYLGDDEDGEGKGTRRRRRMARYKGGRGEKSGQQGQ